MTSKNSKIDSMLNKYFSHVIDFIDDSPEKTILPIQNSKKCWKCNKNNIIEDETGGILVCKDCGIVLTPADYRMDDDFHKIIVEQKKYYGKWCEK